MTATPTAPEPDPPGDQQLAGLTTAISKDPRSLAAALRHENAPQYKLAYAKELQALHDKGVYETILKSNVPPGAKILRLVTTFKTKADGGIKARVCADGSRQEEGVDFNNSYAPVAATAVFRTLLSVAAAKDFHVHHWDVKTAFLNGDLDEDVYTHIPADIDNTDDQGRPLVWKLKKALYGDCARHRCPGSKPCA